MASSPRQQPNAPSTSKQQPVAQQLASLVSKRQSASQQPTIRSSLHPPAAQHQKGKWPTWTGFTGKTLWKWLQLFGIIAVPLVVVGATIAFGIIQADLARKQHDSDQAIANQQHAADQQLALDQQRETTLKTYLDDMSNLLLDRNLRTSKSDDEVRQIARAKTLIVLLRLDPVRKGVLLEFLYETGLIEGPLAGSYLPLKLQGADLSKAFLEGFDLQGAQLSYVNLYMADLSHRANLSEAHLLYAILSGTNLNHADLISAHLNYANLRGADLSSADLHDAYLDGADLSNTDLSSADLTGAIVTSEQLAQAKSLAGATMPDGSTHP